MSVHSEELVATKLPEPPNRTRLIVDDGDEYRVIWRDDGEAKTWGSEHETERWFSRADEHPMELYQYVKYAVAVYGLPDLPLAEFR